MKQIATLIIFLLLAGFHPLLAQQSNRDSCLQACRTGKFYYLSHGDTIYITRTKTQQIETFAGGTKGLVLKIKWQSDTEFTITFKNFINIDQKMSCMNKGELLNVKINQCYPDKFTANYTTEHCGDGFSTFYRLPD